MSATGIDVSTSFSDAMANSANMVNQFGSTYQQAQQAINSRRDIMGQPTQQNPYGNVPNPALWGQPQMMQQPQMPQQYPYAQMPPSYSYGYQSSNSGYGSGSAPAVDVGYPGISDPMYGKDPSQPMPPYGGGY